MALALGAAPALAQEPAACTGGPTALVLSGGGAKGIAHIGVLRALDSLGVRPDLIVGTSMGAIIGGLYASGYSATAIDSIVAALEPATLFASAEPRTPPAWRPLTPQLLWEEGRSGFALESAALDEIRANAALNAAFLRGNLLARGDFDSLPIPFRAVATDLATRDPVVLRSGDLARAIRASIAIPLVFTPERIGDTVYTDGGLSANVPVAIARRLGAARVIVSDVSGRLLSGDELDSPLAVAQQMVSFLFQQPADSTGPDDVKIRIEVEGFSNLNFAARVLDSLRASGRRAADSTLAAAQCLPRARQAAARVPARFGRFEASGVSRADARVLQELLGFQPGEPIDEAPLRERLERLGGLDDYKSLWLTPRADGPDRVGFHLEVQPASKRMVGAAFAYDHDLSGRLGISYLDRKLLGSAFEGSGLFGFSPLISDLTVGIRRYYGVSRSRVGPVVTGRLVQEKLVRYSASGEETGRVRTRQGVVFVGVEQDFGSDWILQLGFDGRVWEDADTLTTSENGPNGHSGGVLFRAGYYGRGTILEGEGAWSGNYRRAEADARLSLRSGKFTFVPRVRVGWGEFLPLQATFPLGGSEGFPGFNVYELRGDREVFVSVQTVLPLDGPLSLRALVAAGRSASGGPLVDSDDWVGGLRVGLGAETPVGPVRVEYGFSTTGRSHLFLRIGRWF